jgi:hypothetical protein
MGFYADGAYRLRNYKLASCCAMEVACGLIVSSFEAQPQETEVSFIDILTVYYRMFVHIYAYVHVFLLVLRRMMLTLCKPLKRLVMCDTKGSTFQTYIGHYGQGLNSMHLALFKETCGNKVVFIGNTLDD